LSHWRKADTSRRRLLAQAGISVCEVTTTLDRLEQAYEQRAADSGVDCRSPALQHAAIGITVPRTL
jgi:hypothetical protein